MRNRTGRKLSAALLGLGLMATAGWVTKLAAGGDQEVENRGDCSQQSDWKARIRTDGPNRLDLEFEGGEVAGQQWRVRLTYNGTRVFNGTATSGPDGEFDVDREVDNAAGPDTLEGVARNLLTGETCRGSVTADF